MENVLITGANRGIGFELTRRYLEHGGKVFACARQPASKELLDLRRTYASQLELLPLDVTSDQSLAALADNLSGKPLDILINNAGILLDKDMSYTRLDWAGWEQTFRVNTIAPMRVSVALLPNLALGKRKIIASITSQMGSISGNSEGGYYLYRSSKAALNAAMKSLAIDLRPHGITVLLIHPGWVRTDMGGPEAPLEPETSAKGIIDVLSGAGLESSGQFIAFDGTPREW